MGYSDRSWSGRARRVLAAAGLLSLATGTLLLLTPVPGSAAVAVGQARSAQAGATEASATKSSALTVKGPKLYDPKTKKPFTTQSTVTVGQTANLVNQFVTVSWTGFTPSSTVSYSNVSTNYAVMVAECKGTDPTQWSDCYMAGQGSQPNASGGAYGLSNEAYATTLSKGTGQASMNVETGAYNQLLGCDPKHPCSLAIVPGQGGEPGHCTNHSLDDNPLQGAFYAQADNTFTSASTGTCSWNDRIIVPLTFSPASSTCSLGNAAFAMDGSPQLFRAAQSWLSGLCTGPHGFGVISNDIDEPQAIQAVYEGSADVALTSQPASADSAAGVTPTGTKTYAYAPLAVTSVAIAYWMDNPATGQPYTNVRFNQRLLVKLLTTSYNFLHDACLPKANHGTLGCDKAVNNNPGSLYTDPEFKQLDPGIKAAPNQGGQFQIPTVQAGFSDLAWTTTRWIGANPAAAAFIKGTPAPGGMHINTDYKGMSYPADEFQQQDGYSVISREYGEVAQPQYVAERYQAENWYPGDNYFPDGQGNFDAVSPEAPGQRSLIALMGDGDAAAYTFPVMAIPNAAGKYVEPTAASMTAAAQSLVSIGSGVQQVNLKNTSPGAYPLTQIVYAMVPTSGVSHTKAAAIARFLDYAAGPGQQSGLGSGQLPAGYVPLPASLRAQTQKIATEVANQTGAKPGSGSGGGGSGGGGSGSGTGGGTSSGGSGQSSSPSHPLGEKATKTSVSLPSARHSGGPVITTVAVAHPTSAAFTRFALPALLVLGGIALLAGSSFFLGSGEAAVRLRRMAAVPRGAASRGLSGFTRGIGRKS